MTENPKKPKSWLSAAALALLLAVGTPSIAMARNADPATPVSREAVVVSEPLPTETQNSEDSQMYTTMMSEQRVGPAERPQGGREKAKERVETLRAERNVTTSADKRQKVCENRKNGLQTKFTRIATNSQRFQSRIDDVYAKALVYQTDKAITSPELIDLIAAADDAKTQAGVSVLALQDAKPTTLDCKNVDVATDVASFKESAVQARDDLKTYKQAVLDVLKSLKAATVNSEETVENEPETEGVN